MLMLFLVTLPTTILWAILGYWMENNFIIESPAYWALYGFIFGMFITSIIFKFS